jgi:hypothetical protein
MAEAEEVIQYEAPIPEDEALAKGLKGLYKNLFKILVFFYI